VTFAALAVIGAAAGSEPFLPKDDNEVLEVLPRSLYSSRDELDTLRRQLARDPKNVDLAVIVASRYLQVGKSAGDPRFEGYARAAIQPWWQDAKAPAEILRVRSKLKERDHQYDQALADLKLLLELEPRDVQAWIELANIYRVQGKYAEARHACDSLGEFAGREPTLICNIPLLAVTGEAEAAYDSLVELLPTVRQQWPTAVQWVLTMQAEISRALGRDQQAERHYREALANDPGDLYLIRSYGDFLLDQGREQDALSLFGEHITDTGVLLEAAIAARRAGQEALAAGWRTQLQSRFDENRLRGNRPHGRYEARFELELRHNPRRALALAEENWQQQKQPPDGRILLEAAIAAKEPARAQAVLQFLREHHTQDVVLERLARELERQ
jgi:Tfp pilus assembly protein PilF